MTEINRRAVLRALARAGALTAERSDLVRLADPDEVRHELVAARMPAVVLDAAGLPFRRQRPAASEQAVERAVRTHLLALGLPAAPVCWIGARDGARVDLDPAWQRARGHESFSVGIRMGIPERVGYVLARHRDAAWAPLAELADRGVWAFGLSAQGEMLLARIDDRR